MDYLPAHQSYHPRGIIYNANRPVGIRYYNPATDQANIKANEITIKKALEIEPVFRSNQLPRPKYQIKLKAHDNPEPRKIGSKNGGIKYHVVHQESKKPESPKKKYQKVQKNDVSGKYIVNVQNHKIDFSAEGIEKAHLSYSERQWLRKAQYYFINAKEGRRKIGSAESYTTMEILEALWSTAKDKDIDPKRFLVQIYNETRFNPNLTGKARERGLGQFKKATAKGLGYNWGKMTSGTKAYAYQAKCAAEFVAKVGEATYNGAGYKSRHYVSRIDKHLNRINKTKMPAKLAKL